MTLFYFANFFGMMRAENDLEVEMRSAKTKQRQIDEAWRLRDNEGPSPPSELSTISGIGEPDRPFRADLPGFKRNILKRSLSNKELPLEERVRNAKTLGYSTRSISPGCVWIETHKGVCFQIDDE